MYFRTPVFFFFFFNDTATTEIYTLSLHDALPISLQPIPYSHKQHIALGLKCGNCHEMPDPGELMGIPAAADRKSTRLNSSHSQISYAVFCLKKKKKKKSKRKLYT